MTVEAGFARAGVDVALRDGRTVRVRPVRPDDAEGLRAFLEALPERDLYFRFFSTAVNLRKATERMAAQADGLALVAVSGEQDAIVGHATYMPESARAAETAFAIAPAWQGQGLATTLLTELAEEGARAGIETFTAVVLPENHRMVDVFRHSGFPTEVRSLPGELEVTFPTEPGEEGRTRFARRERRAAVAAVRPVLEPESVATVGPGGIAPRQIPQDLDLAVLTMPTEEVLEAARACAAAGTRAVIVTAALDDPAELLRICRSAGMRLVGPESLGAINTHRGLYAVVSRVTPPAGRVAFASQGGPFGTAGLALGETRGIGFSSFVSLGGKADLSGNDFLQFWESDDETDVVLLYLESFGNPRRFGRVTRRMTADKPVVVLKSGRSAGGAAGGSRSGALLAATDTTLDALFGHAGVIRAGTPAEMFDVAAVLSHEPLPAGERVAVVANARGPATMGAEACAAAGLEVSCCATMDDATGADELPARVRELAAGADAVIVVHVRAGRASGQDVAATLRADCDFPVPVLGAFVGGPVPSPPAVEGGRLPVFGSAEAAARALRQVARYAAYLRTRRAEGPPPEGLDADRAAGVLAAALRHGGGWLEAPAAEALLDSYGIPIARSVTVATPSAVARAAAELGAPVAVKAQAPGLVRKTEVGGVELDRRSAAAAQRSATRLRARLRDQGLRPTGFLVQRMAPPGVELIVGAAGDPEFGPLVVVGAGGAAAELVGDVQVRLAPLDHEEAGQMVRALRTFPLLDGFRGAPRVDLAAVADVVVRVGALVAAHPEIAELDCDPLIAGREGALVTDARVRVTSAPAPRPFGALDR